MNSSVFTPAAAIAAGGAGTAHGPEGGVPAAVTARTALHNELVRACLASAPGAWDEFVGTFAGLLGYVVDRTSRQHGMPLPSGERDDVIAEILVELLRNDAAALRAFAGRASLPTYLTVIARRVAVRSLQRARDRRPIPMGDGTHAADRHDGVNTLADREAVEVLLETLDETEARLVRLHHLEARSYGEISRLTGLPVGSIGPALSKARQKMRDHAAGTAVS
ncbi:MAG: sigma-70 family RNA polymerase sigma factor [Planctomycetia bacterium]